MTFDTAPSYRIAYVVAVVLAAVSAIIVLIQAADPVSLGFTPVEARWLGILSGGIAVALSFLPRVTTPQSRTELKAQVRDQAFNEGAAQVAQVVVSSGSLPPPPPAPPPDFMKSAGGT